MLLLVQNEVNSLKARWLCIAYKQILLFGLAEKFGSLVLAWGLSRQSHSLMLGPINGVGPNLLPHAGPLISQQTPKTTAKIQNKV